MFNLFTLALGACVLGIALAVLVTRRAPALKTPMVMPEEDYDTDPKNKPALAMEDLYKLAERICAENELNVIDRTETTPDEVDWIAESKNEVFYGYYVFGFLKTNQEHDIVSLQDVLKFKDFVKGAESRKGFFFTTGYFARDVHQPLEGPKVSLYNRQKVLSELNL